MITAAANGDAEALGRLVARDPSLSREGYFYTPPIHFAVREGHLSAVEILLEAGADSEWNGYGESLGRVMRYLPRKLRKSWPC